LKLEACCLQLEKGSGAGAAPGNLCSA